MVFADFELLLSNTMGLDPASIGSSTIERAVRERTAACHLHDAGAYLQLVRSAETERQELIEALVVPETWFFRDPKAVAALVRMVLEEWSPAAKAQSVLRLLSLPCSTGEEPYSLAMALLEAGFPPQRFHIDAIDISSRALARAEHAVYGKNSFRGNDLAFRDRHFTPTGSNYRLHDTVRESVHLQQGNMLSGDFLPGADVYDAIYCRNLLIYFDARAQAHALEVLRRLLAAHGLLFVGPAETGILQNHGFVAIRAPLAFAFRKREASAPEPKSHVPLPAGHPHAPVTRVPPIRRKPVPAQRAPAAVPSPASSANLEDATRLADRGHFAEASRMCAAYARARGPSAPAFHLMGLIDNATGDLANAVGHFRKTLYLDPNHYDALTHLALILEKQGDTVGAQTLRKRMRRLDMGK
jgi:chemotaxis protein methyltransferase WspC